MGIYGNLNEVEPDWDWQQPNAKPFEIIDNSITVADQMEVSAYFRDLDKHLINVIGQYNGVFGCVAWLTHFDVLDALAGVEYASVIVQKEDFLRPDDGASKSTWKNKLREKYQGISCDMDRYAMEKLSELSVCGDPSMYGVRCAGNHNREKIPACPRMHNKFLVFCDVTDRTDHNGMLHWVITPKAVWTGSFNFTANGGNSLENAVLIKNSDLSSAYFSEWQQIYSISEPLDWTDDWCSPEYRVGT